MPVYSPSCLVFVDGSLLDDDRLEAHTVHGLDAPVATATVVLSLPRPASVLFNKVVEIQALIDGEAGRIFQGVIRADADTLDDQGMTATLNCQGWAYILAMPAIADTVWTGPISARRVIRGVLESYAFGGLTGPKYKTVEILDDTGATVMLGGNADVDAGQVRWKKGDSGLAFINRIANLWGYYGYDCPDGVFRVTRAVGEPSVGAVRTWTESVDVLTDGRDRDAGPVANWIEVIGATPTPADGTRPDAYRSFPSVVPANALIPEPGAKYFSVSDDLLVSTALCDGVRHVQEIMFNSADPATTYSWTSIAHPRLQPGQKVFLISPTIDSSARLWLTSISQDFTADGYWASYVARRDTGTALADGDDLCVTVDLLTGPVHVGDETLSYYAVPSPSGHVVTVDFTPVAAYTSISLDYEAHGVNSYLIGGGNTGSDVSKYRIEQPVGTEIGSGVMPMAAENYGSPPTWAAGSVPIPGTLAGGVAARLFIQSGYDARAVDGPYDDFEIRNLVLSNCAQGSPDLPGGPSNPPIPPPVPPTPVCLVSIASGTVTAGTYLTLPAFTVPQVPGGHTAHVTIRATLASMNGLPSSIPGADNRTLLPDQAPRWLVNGGWAPWLVPGTYTPGDPSSGTVFTGSGVGEYTWILDTSSSSYTTVPGLFILQAFNTTWSFTDLCLSYVDTP